MRGAGCRVEDVEKLEKSPLIAKDIPIYGVIYHTEVRHSCSYVSRNTTQCTRQGMITCTVAVHQQIAFHLLSLAPR